MSVRVVDSFEVVNVDHNAGDGMFSHACGSPNLIDFFEERSSIETSRQRISCRKNTQLFVLLADFFS